MSGTSQLVPCLPLQAAERAAFRTAEFASTGDWPVTEDAVDKPAHRYRYDATSQSVGAHSEKTLMYFCLQRIHDLSSPPSPRVFPARISPGLPAPLNGGLHVTFAIRACLNPDDVDGAFNAETSILCPVFCIPALQERLSFLESCQPMQFCGMLQSRRALVAWCILVT